MDEETRMPIRLLLLRHPGIAPVPPAAIISALTPAQQGLQREDVEIDTRPLDAQVSQGDWGGQGAHLAEQAATVREKLGSLGSAELHYFGLAEIPHVIALGALLGDEIPIVLHEYDRDAKSWAWPTDGKTLDARIVGVPEGTTIHARGSIVLRVAISAPISDTDVSQVVGGEHLADVTVTLAEDRDPGTCKVRSSKDLQTIRERIRAALAAIRARFPNFEALHVFAAAPVSVCFALGQELKPRNSPPIQTYRYRKVDGQPAYSPAIELSSELEARADQPLTPEEHAIADAVRQIWRDALPQVQSYAQETGSGNDSEPWYDRLATLPELHEVHPYPPLPPLSRMVPPGATVSQEPVPREYEFETPTLVWHLDDRLLVGLHESTSRDGAETLRLIRLFLFHEYLHAYHSLTAYRARDIGAFPNCLEHADYAADSYALLHQLDLEARRGGLKEESAKLGFLRRQLERVVLSFWAFESRPPVREWQVRRFRRYLNWYWRLTQISAAPTLLTALRLLDHAPHIEIAGPHQFARGQRVFCRLDRLDPGARPELALVLENEKLLRVPDSTTSNLLALLAAFQNRDHDPIVRFFRGVYEAAADLNGALPE